MPADGDVKSAEEVLQRARRVAHDLRNVLVNLMGIASEIEASGPGTSGSTVRELITTTELANRLSRLLIEPEKPVEDAVVCRPAAVLTFGRASLERVAAPFRLQLDLEDTGRIGMTADSLRRIAINLVRNAREAAGPDGAIALRLREELIASSHTRRWVVLQALDRGPPLEADVTSSSGTGLGLTVVHELTSWAGGTVDIDRTATTGWVVTLRFPVV